MKSALFFRTIAVALAILILAIMVTQVFFRYVLEDPIMWAEELARYSYVWMVFLAAIFVTAEHSHVTVTLADDRLSQRFRRMWEGLVAFLVAAACFVIAFGSFSWLQEVAGGSSAALGLPSEIYYGVVWGAFILMGLYSVIRGFLILRDKDATNTASEVDQALEESVGA
ncbi:TRAP transporter small permease [Yaniella halotolerans]|uniref:TRAP transporter small permease n=1 Tax=Yaniella halotolerans TaxID=225453 RepID=UPI0003B5976C|nr:TRAP transporter small permease [Yaniella halotolerans]